MLARVRAAWDEYPRQFWTLFGGTLINSLGSGLIMPFLSLYLTGRLGFSMTEVGLLFVIYAVISAVAGLAAGPLVDRLGRRPIMLFSLFGGALATLGLGMGSLPTFGSGLARLGWLVVVIPLAGLTGSAFTPAANAMVADLVGREQRAQAYGLLRVVQNLGIAIAPALGGLIAARSYLALFAMAAFASALYGLIALLHLHETRPQTADEGQAASPDALSARGMGSILRDRVFLLFGGLCLLWQVVYAQMNTTLPVYLDRSFGVSAQWYGLLMSLNATMVVLFQFPITRLTARRSRAAMMAVGMAFFAVGFGSFGFVRALPLFFVAQAVWTIGEMIVMPVSQAFVADIAPETLRGSYMGLFGLTWVLGYGLGPLLGGGLMDTVGGKYIWYAAFVLNMVALAGFLLLERRMKQRAAVPTHNLTPP